MSSGALTSPSQPIGYDLERIRLEHRARRLELAIAALNRLQDQRTAGGTRTPPMSRATATFALELSTVRRRLVDLGHGRRALNDLEEV
jgi:hypothetical protein